MLGHWGVSVGGVGAPTEGHRHILPASPQDTELLDLRETIDFLKKKNSEAQAVIQGALSGTDVTPKGEVWQWAMFLVPRDQHRHVIQSPWGPCLGRTHLFPWSGK